MKRILAIDAAKRFGWAYGPAGSRPVSGSHSCSPDSGASRGAIFKGAGKWIVGFLQSYPADVLVIEAPLISGAPMPRATSEILQGLPAVFEHMAFIMGVHTFDRPAVSSVRKHFLGHGKPENPKQKTFAKCRALGWIGPDDADQSFDRADALALWSYAEARHAARYSQPVDDLFVSARARGRAG